MQIAIYDAIEGGSTQCARGTRHLAENSAAGKSISPMDEALYTEKPVFNGSHAREWSPIGKPGMRSHAITRERESIIFHSCR
jgi:hypothetical protein